MKFVYDILLNLNETRVYDFYEWSEKDSIEFFKRIPIFKIDNESYKNKDRKHH